MLRLYKKEHKTDKNFKTNPSCFPTNEALFLRITGFLNLKELPLLLLISKDFELRILGEGIARNRSILRKMVSEQNFWYSKLDEAKYGKPFYKRASDHINTLEKRISLFNKIVKTEKSEWDLKQSRMIKASNRKHNSK